MRQQPRYAGLAAFAPQSPLRAVKEMERGIRDLKLNGFISNSHTFGEYMDDRKYWPILEAAAALDAPIYIHPRSPNDAMSPYYGDLNLDRAMWGYHTETGLHAMRLILSGVFDRYPTLRIVLGHMGEGIPYYLWRIDKRYRPEVAPLQRKPSEYFRDNFYITTSGMNSLAPLKYCLEVLGPDRILWAIDYPYEETAESVQWLDAAALPNDVKEKVWFRNAEKVFKIAPV